MSRKLYPELYQSINEMLDPVTLGVSAGLAAAIGIVAYEGVKWGLPKLKRGASEFLYRVNRGLKRHVENQARQATRDEREAILDLLAADAQLAADFERYLELASQVEKATGKRGPKFAAMRREKTELSKSITARIQGVMDSHLDTLTPTRQRALRRTDAQRMRSMYRNRLGENKMKLTKGQLKRIIREEYSQLKRRGLIKESYGAIDSHAVAEAAFNAYQEGIRKLSDFIEYFIDGYPDMVDGVPMKTVRSELAAQWKLEKAANRRSNKYDNWSAWD